MKTRIRRRIWSTAALVFVSAVLLVSDSILRTAHIRTSKSSGWLMLGMVLFLSLFSLRKKFSFLPASLFPIGTAAGWLQFHIYVGLMTSIVFLIHVGFRVPSGVLERILAFVYITTFLSGVIGLALSRYIPRRLTARGEEVLFERIPLFRRSLLDEVQSLSYPESKENPSSALVDLHEKHLRDFFTGPRNMFAHLMFSDRPRMRLLQFVSGCRPYLSIEESSKLDRLTELVHQKDNLDFHLTHQGLLKLWLFVHIPLSYSLLVFAFFHMIVVYAFT